MIDITLTSCLDKSMYSLYLKHMEQTPVPQTIRMLQSKISRPHLCNRQHYRKSNKFTPVIDPLIILLALSDRIFRYNYYQLKNQQRVDFIHYNFPTLTNLRPPIRQQAGKHNSPPGTH